MAFCTNCGTQVPDGTKFCPGCGQKLAVKASAADVRQADADQAAQSPDSAPQQSYTPPVQQSYPPPVQQSYTPPVQQGYSTQPGYASASNAPKQKKPLHKKTLLLIGGAALLVIIAVILIIVLGGKGKNAIANDPNLGVYNAKTASMLGMDMNVTDLFQNGFSIELKANGKCVINADGTKGGGKWTLAGDAFHVEGGGLDCSGTLQAGILTLENVLGTGIALGFEKEGGYTAPAAGSDVLTPLQQQWNGTWFGCLCVSESTGDYAAIPSDFYDVYMTVNVDGQGRGSLGVYLDGAKAAFAIADCQAKETGLYATGGTLAGGVRVNTDNWTLLPMPDYPDQYTMNDAIGDGDSLFHFSLFMKKWGGSWQAEIDSGLAITPPSVAWYETAIASREQPPTSGGGASSDGAASTQSGSPTGGDYAFAGPTATYDCGTDGRLLFTYPTDEFTFDNYWEKLETLDESLSISFMLDWNEGEIQADLDRFNSFSDFDGFSLEKLTVAGYEATRMTYSDSLGYTVETLIDFGTSVGEYRGVRVIVISYNSFDECTSAVVEAIIASIQAK